MQRVRFSSPDAYEKFKVVFGDTRHHLMQLPGFLHLTWWEHPDDPTWFNECSFWTSKEALYDWHMDTYHKPQACEGVGRQWRDHGRHHHQLRARRNPAPAHLSVL